MPALRFPDYSTEGAIVADTTRGQKVPTRYFPTVAAWKAAGSPGGTATSKVTIGSPPEDEGVSRVATVPAVGPPAPVADAPPASRKTEKQREADLRRAIALSERVARGEVIGEEGEFGPAYWKSVKKVKAKLALLQEREQARKTGTSTPEFERYVRTAMSPFSQITPKGVTIDVATAVRAGRTDAQLKKELGVTAEDIDKARTAVAISRSSDLALLARSPGGIQTIRKAQSFGMLTPEQVVTIQSDALQRRSRGRATAKLKKHIDTKTGELDVTSAITAGIDASVIRTAGYELDQKEYNRTKKWVTASPEGKFGILVAAGTIPGDAKFEGADKSGRIKYSRPVLVATAPSSPLGSTAQWRLEQMVKWNPRTDPSMSETEINKAWRELPGNLKLAIYQASPEYRQAVVSTAIAVTPVVGTVYFWEDMSPAWRTVSVVADVLFLASLTRLPGVIARGVTGTTKEAQAIKSAVKVTENIPARLLPDDLLPSVRAVTKAQVQYADDLYRAQRQAKLAETVAGEVRPDVVRQAEVLAESASKSRASMVGAVERYVKDVKAKFPVPGMDDPSVLARLDDLPVNLVKHTEQLVQNALTPTRTVAQLRTNLVAKQRTLQVLKTQYPTKQERWLGALGDVARAESELRTAEMGNVTVLHANLMATRDIIPEIQRLLRTIRKGSREAGELQRSLSEYEALEKTLENQIRSALLRIEDIGELKWVKSGTTGRWEVAEVGPPTGGVGVRTTVPVAPLKPLTVAQLRRMGDAPATKVLTAVRGVAGAAETGAAVERMTAAQAARLGLTDSPEEDVRSRRILSDITRTEHFRKLLPAEQANVREIIWETVKSVSLTVTTPTEWQQAATLIREGVKAMSDAVTEGLSQPAIRQVVSESVQAKNVTVTAPLTQAQVRAVVRPITRTRVTTRPDIPLEPIEPVVPLKPLSPPPPVEGDVGREARIPPGAIAWRQGMFWKYIPPPWNQGKPITLPKGVTPVGAINTGLRTPQETVQMIGKPGAKVPESVSVDLGAFDLEISDSGRTIRFVSGGEETDVGGDIGSLTTGMSIPSRGIGRRVVTATPRRQRPKQRPPRRGRRESWLDKLTSLRGMKY